MEWKEFEDFAIGGLRRGIPGTNCSEAIMYERQGDIKSDKGHTIVYRLTKEPTRDWAIDRIITILDGFLPHDRCYKRMSKIYRTKLHKSKTPYSLSYKNIIDQPHFA